MISLQEYRKDPCKTLSIPYWKAKNLVLPEGMAIVHESAFCEEEWRDYVDEIYFRLYHHGKEIPSCATECALSTVTENEIGLMADMINQSYQDIRVDRKQLERDRQGTVSCLKLWILAREPDTYRPMGCGIAAFDSEVGEVSLEWIQVLPEFRRRGIGQAIVTELLQRASALGAFVTVSGRVDNETCPERLYRKCEFAGQDRWHILRRK